MSEVTNENEKDLAAEENNEDLAQEEKLVASDDNSESAEDNNETNELENLKAELEKAKNDYLYLRADFDNYRKKAIEERAQWRKYGAEPVMRELVGIIDNFDLALMTEVTPENLDSFHQGVKMIRSEISSSLERAGVREIDATGQAFDPNLHEALSAEESTEVEDGHVLRVFKKAYKLHDRLLRPAQVIVAKKPSAEDN